MPLPHYRRSPARGLACLAALVSLSAWPLASLAANYSMVVTGCTAADRATAQADGAINLRGGYVKSGRNPPRLTYVCSVPNPNLDLGAPGYSRLKLQARDPNTPAGNVKARLYRKNRVSGKVGDVAVALSTTSNVVTSSTVNLAAALDFETFAYYIVVELATPVPGVEVEAHLVSLEP